MARTKDPLSRAVFPHQPPIPAALGPDQQQLLGSPRGVPGGGGLGGPRHRQLLAPFLSLGSGRHLPLPVDGSSTHQSPRLVASSQDLQARGPLPGRGLPVFKLPGVSLCYGDDPLEPGSGEAL